MKCVIPLFVILVGLLTACQQTNQKDDPEKLKSVLMDYFNGIKTKDFQKMKEVTTSDFILFEATTLHIWHLTGWKVQLLKRLTTNGN